MHQAGDATLKDADVFLTVGEPADEAAVQAVRDPVAMTPHQPPMAGHRRSHPHPGQQIEQVDMRCQPLGTLGANTITVDIALAVVVVLPVEPDLHAVAVILAGHQHVVGVAAPGAGGASPQRRPGAWVERHRARLAKAYGGGVDSEVISTAGTAISLLALLISTLAWRATRRSAAADERMSQVETIRLRGELNPEWHIESFTAKGRAAPLTIRAALVGPARLAVPCDVKAQVVLSTGYAASGSSDTDYILATRGERSRSPLWLAMPRSNRRSAEAPPDGIPLAESAEPSTLYFRQRMRVGDELLIRLPPLLDGSTGRRSLSVEIEALVHPLEPWATTKELPIDTPDPPAAG